MGVNPARAPLKALRIAGQAATPLMVQEPARSESLLQAEFGGANSMSLLLTPVQGHSTAWPTPSKDQA